VPPRPSPRPYDDSSRLDLVGAVPTLRLTPAPSPPPPEQLHLDWRAGSGASPTGRPARPTATTSTTAASSRPAGGARRPLLTPARLEWPPASSSPTDTAGYVPGRRRVLAPDGPRRLVTRSLTRLGVRVTLDRPGPAGAVRGHAQLRTSSAPYSSETVATGRLVFTGRSSRATSSTMNARDRSATTCASSPPDPGPPERPGVTGLNPYPTSREHPTTLLDPGGQNACNLVRRNPRGLPPSRRDRKPSPSGVGRPLYFPASCVFDLAAVCASTPSRTSEVGTWQRRPDDRSGIHACQIGSRHSGRI